MTCYKSKIKVMLSKKLFLTLTSLFLLMRSALLVIPFPFGHITYLLFSDQTPRYFLFLGWELLALWLGSALLTSSNQSRLSRTLLSSIFIVLLIILLIVSIIYCLVAAVFPFPFQLLLYSCLLIGSNG